MRIHKTLSLLSVLFLPVQSVVAGGDVSLATIIEGCTECHSQQGKAAISGWPPIAGMAKDDIVGKLKGHRLKVVDDSMMSKVAHDLSDQQIEQIAEYYSALKGEK